MHYLHYVELITRVPKAKMTTTTCDTTNLEEKDVQMVPTYLPTNLPTYLFTYLPTHPPTSYNVPTYVSHNLVVMC
jgi:hypothetical protein